MTNAMVMREVGGCVRDALLGLRSKDVDFSVEIPELVGQDAEVGFRAMRDELVGRGFELFEERPEHLTVRARFPREDERRGRLTADFVLCRVDGPYSDGRRPDYVRVGTCRQDQARRDFTVNSMARDVDGLILDPFGGKQDLERRLLRFVGDPRQRLLEDPLRALRALRFCVTKGFELAQETAEALQDEELPSKLASSIALERRRDELRMCFQADTLGTLDLLHEQPFASLRGAALQGLKLGPSSRKVLAREQD